LALTATAAGLAGARRRVPGAALAAGDPASADAGPPPAPGRSAPAGVALPVATLPFLVVALSCWYLTFAQSNWAWERVPGLPLFQFPWRMFGPLGICLAVAGAGALAGPLGALERRRGDTGRAAGLAVVLALAAVTLFNHLGDREFHFLAGPF